MAFALAYTMVTGSGVSSCGLAADALARHRELVRAGGTQIVVRNDGVIITLAQLEALAVATPITAVIRRL